MSKTLLVAEIPSPLPFGTQPFLVSQVQPSLVLLVFLAHIVMTTHYWCSIEVQLNAGVVKPGTAIFARVSHQGNKPWQQWGSTKPATFIKDTQRVTLPSLIYGTSVDPPELSVSVHIASLGGNGPAECWDVGEGSLEGPTSDKSNSCVLKRSGNVVGALYLTPITLTATSSSTIEKEFVVFNAIAVQLDKMDSGIGAKSDPYFIVYNKVSTTQRVIIFKSHFVKQSLMPNWGTIVIPKGVLGGSNGDHPLEIEVWDWDKDSEMGGDDLIGSFELTLNDIMENKKIHIVNAQKKAAYDLNKKGYYTKSGTFMIGEARTLTFDPNMYDAQVFDLLRIKFNLVGALGAQDKAKASKGQHPSSTIAGAIEQVWSYVKEYQTPSQNDATLFGFDPNGMMRQYPDTTTFFGAPGTHPDLAFEAANASITADPSTKITLLINDCIVKALDDKKKDVSAYNVFFLFVHDSISDLDDCLDALVTSSDHPCSFVVVGMGDQLKCKWAKSWEKVIPSSFGLATKIRWASRDNVSFLPIAAISSALGPSVAASRIISQVREYMYYQKLYEEKNLDFFLRPCI